MCACRYTEAAGLLWDVIRLAPNMPDAYETLGTVHEALGEPLKAINLYMIAAHLTPKARSTVLQPYQQQEYGARSASSSGTGACSAACHAGSAALWGKLSTRLQVPRPSAACPSYTRLVQLPLR